MYSEGGNEEVSFRRHVGQAEEFTSTATNANPPQYHEDEGFPLQLDSTVVSYRRTMASMSSEESSPHSHRDNNGSSRNAGDKYEENDQDDADCKETRLSLMEEILLLGLKDREGYTSFWNDSLSSGLRGAMLVELGLRGRLALEPGGMRRRGLLMRKVIVQRDQATGDGLLDETLQLVKANEPATTREWIEYLSGESWNPLKLRLQLRQVRQRLAKNLHEKGVCTVEKQNFGVFEMTTHPLVDIDLKARLVQRVHDGLLGRYCNDTHRFNPRLLSLLLLAQASDVLESVLNSLSDADFDLSMKRMHTLSELDFDIEATKEGTCELMWAVFAAFHT